MAPQLLGAVSLVPLLVLAYTALRLQSRGWRIASTLLWLTAFHEAVLVVFPIWYSVFTEFALDSAVNAGPADLLPVMAGEALFVSVFCLTVGFGLRGTAPARSVYRMPRLSTLMLYMLIASELVISSYSMLSLAADWQVTSHHADIYSPLSLLDMLMEWVRGAVQRPGIVASAVVVSGPRYSRAFRFAAAAALGLVALGGLAEGVRGRATWIVCILLAMSLIRRSWTPAITAACVLALVAPYSVFLAGPYRVILLGASRTRLEALTNLSEIVGEGGTDGDESFVHNMARRAQGPRNSVVLTRLHDSGLGASYKPLLSALYTPIPRLLWPGKSPAGSTDGTNYGAAIFLVRRLGYGAPIFNMGPVLASSHAYWEGGWFWLVGCAVLTGAVWYYILWWCRRRLPDDFGTTLAITFSAALPIDGLFTMLSPLYALIALFWSAIVPVLLIRWALRRVMAGKTEEKVAGVVPTFEEVFQFTRLKAGSSGVKPPCLLHRSTRGGIAGA
jgi:hypothetical protein